ncbi:hypothetical protein [Moritella viscosa]|uniref:Uncharacterized protein n=1 Tax=Moritella viscosa TaxID=80854 RepID=A0A090IKG4_9GAMM|nr:hypothetical protein [Moritella viscosa]CED61842.1 putative lipoprotein [Moritella viscosa]SGY91055.1 Putative uncharacterized protein [Moritella viscosa]SGY95314.1 Putative uncharacterized protein [Moritella viscosa]SGY95709.1 Putative uncharacterized protein [Moritella viscosa]SGZ00295.1 Putative uncharacterized protein [Moritella viscosa]
MRKSIITSVLASLLLSGCGSGGSGGSDSSNSGSTPTTKYRLQFVQLVERAENTGDARCTLFDVGGQASGKETYAKLATDVTVKMYDKNGDFVEDLSSSITTAGILSIAKNSVADGGYISVIDSPSDTDSFYKVLSIQKALLGDLMIAVERNQGVNSSCYKETPITMKTGYASVTPNGIPSSTWAYDSSQSEIAAVAFTSKKVSAYGNEDVLVRAYFGGTDLVDYAFVSTLTPGDGGDRKHLSGVAFPTHNWTIGQRLTGQLSGLSVRLNRGNYSYPWLDATFVAATGVTTGFAYVDTETNWSYNATGRTTSNWNFRHNDELLPVSLDVNLPTELTLRNDDSEINTLASNFVFQARGIDSTLTRLQRSSYYIDVTDIEGKTNTLNHVIYSEVASGENVIIPNLALTNLDDPTSATNLTTAVLSADSLTADLKTFFMYENAVSDLVSVVLSPADIVQNNKTKYTDTYTLLNR